MFANLFFLILTLLLFTSATEQSAWPLFSDAPGSGFLCATLVYLFLMIYIYFQNRWLSRVHLWSKEKLRCVVNLQLLLFFAVSFFALGSLRLPNITFSPFGQTAALVYTLLQYFTALVLGDTGLDNSEGSWKDKLSKAMSAACFIIPFAIPFFLFSFVGEAEALIPFKSPSFENFALLAINILTIIAAFIFLPPLAILFWRCSKLEDESLAASLDELCKKAGFRHAGFRIWNVMHDSITAAIVGVIAPFHYILFTPKLLALLPPRALKAVVAHEIGHHRRHHLLVYPFILFGMIGIGSAITMELYPYFLQLAPLMGISSSDPLLEAITLAGLFITFALILAAYFRVVFGYFSRLFERQADLFIFEVQIPVEDIVDALDLLGSACGDIHNTPNWHHHSIQERIDFLHHAQRDPTAITRHHQKVKTSLLIYSIFLLLLMIYLIVKMM